MDSIIDLRSDTVTKPSPQMRRAMAEAEVGDDVYGEDPTVNRLQELAASLLGKEAALFVVSGTMANQVAVKAHTQPGDEVIMEKTSHPYNYESGALAAISGVQVRLLEGQYGILEPDQVEDAIRPHEHHFAPTRLICLENTHNRGGGAIYPMENIEGIARVAAQNGLAMHLDGARLFNASVAKGIPACEYAKHFESVSFCLSKGLGAPVGSLISGSARFIDRCHRFRKMVGGGMRQAGIIAAAGIYALQNNISRLSEDHHNAALLAEGLSCLTGVSIDLARVETNIVYFELRHPGFSSAAQLAQELKKHGVLVQPTAKHTVRAVTHLNVNQEDIKQAVKIMAEILAPS